MWFYSVCCISYENTIEIRNGWEMLHSVFTSNAHSFVFSRAFFFAFCIMYNNCLDGIVMLFESAAWHRTASVGWACIDYSEWTMAILLNQYWIFRNGKRKDIPIQLNNQYQIIFIYPIDFVHESKWLLGAKRSLIETFDWYMFHEDTLMEMVMAWKWWGITFF